MKDGAGLFSGKRQSFPFVGEGVPFVVVLRSPKRVPTFIADNLGTRYVQPRIPKSLRCVPDPVPLRKHDVHSSLHVMSMAVLCQSSSAGSVWRIFVAAAFAHSRDGQQHA